MLYLWGVALQARSFVSNLLTVLEQVESSWSLCFGWFVIHTWGRETWRRVGSRQRILNRNKFVHVFHVWNAFRTLHQISIRSRVIRHGAVECFKLWTRRSVPDGRCNWHKGTACVIFEFLEQRQPVLRRTLVGEFDVSPSGEKRHRNSPFDFWGRQFWATARLEKSASMVIFLPRGM